MPPQERGSLRIKKPVERKYFSRQENDNEFSNENGLRIAKAQLKRYENDPEWNSSENRNNAINFLKYQRIPLLLKRIEAICLLYYEQWNDAVVVLKIEINTERNSVNKSTFKYINNYIYIIRQSNIL